ncbi:MAG: lipopolysaccharide/colanic/teichoic acid biosynthesis glycosyltransferase [Verrucomicrobiales bacterium]|jgi:lipopolysaccharide/colanic/teichoic acid biosynthesis glycosyltransferase
MKRCFDHVMAAALLLIASPILLLIAGFVRGKLGSPVFFRQLRPGLHGRAFQLIKFRTMGDSDIGGYEILSDEERLTKFGGWLRSSSLDELPELWNVLSGEMSLVGPRPLLMEYLPLYSSEQSRRHEVKPGITGWAQVNGRNAISWEEKFAMDVWYVKNRSLWLDLKIILMTIGNVVLRRDIAADGHATMPVFEGTKK